LILSGPSCHQTKRHPLLVFKVFDFLQNPSFFDHIKRRSENTKHTLRNDDVLNFGERLNLQEQNKSMTPKENYNSLLAQKVIKELKRHNIQGFYFETKEEALKKVLEIVPSNSTVSWGGSVTLHETGLIDALKKGEYNVLDASDRSKGGDEMNRIAHEALNSDYYFLSANAISASGELINMDGIGNRVASLIYGPKNVIVIAGINKVELNLDLAINRAKTIAAPLGVLGYDKNVSTFDELLDKAQGISSQLVITTMSVFEDRIKVILIGEPLGY
jgi:hypothetical protein